jgi:hypothetical protein
MQNSVANCKWRHAKGGSEPGEHGISFCLLTPIQDYNQNIYGRAAHIVVSGTVA